MKSKLLPDLARRSAAWMPDWMLAGMYRLGPLSRWLRRALNRSLPDGLQTVQIASGTLQGRKMKLDLQREKDYWLGSYELDLVRELKQQLGDKQVAYDVGANIGYISLVMAELLDEGGKVFSFEALPANLERLKENVAFGQREGQIEVVPKAVAEESGLARFKVHASGGMGKLASAQGRKEHYEREIQVEALSLDAAVYELGLPAPQLLKIDIEGGEGAALQGAERLLAEQRPTLLIELHGQAAAQEVFKVLARHNYQVRDLTSGKRLAKDAQDLDWKSYIVAEAKA